MGTNFSLVIIILFLLLLTLFLGIGAVVIFSLLIPLLVITFVIFFNPLFTLALLIFVSLSYLLIIYTKPQGVKLTRKLRRDRFTILGHPIKLTKINISILLVIVSLIIAGLLWKLSNISFIFNPLQLFGTEGSIIEILTIIKDLR